MKNNPYNEPHADRDREPLKVGYQCYNGATLTCQAHIDDYNRMSAEIHRWEDSGRGVPSHLLDERHRHFVIMCALALEGVKLKPIMEKLTTNVETLRERNKFILGYHPKYSVFGVTADGSWSRILITGNAYDAAKAAWKESLHPTGKNVGVDIRVDGVSVAWA